MTSSVPKQGLRKPNLIFTLNKRVTATFFLVALSLANVAHAAELVVGQVGPIVGLQAPQAKAYAAGMNLVFDAANRIRGATNTFRLVRRDDGGRAEDTVSVTRKLIEDEKPIILAGFFGSKNLALLSGSGLLEREKIALVGYRTAELQIDDPQFFSVRAGISEEIARITQHLSTIGIRDLGIFYEEGAGATRLVAVADELAKKTGVAFAVRASYSPGTARVTSAVELFLKRPPQAILLVTSSAAAAGFIEQYRTADGAAKIFSHSGVDIEQLNRQLTEEQLQGVAIAQVTPSPYKNSSSLSKEFADAVAASADKDLPVSYAMMEGYIAGKVIVEAVRRQGSKVSRQTMMATLDALAAFDLGGYAIGFKPGSHTGSKFVELSIVTSSGRIRQ